MAKDIYKKLARHLDNLPGGFPSTENGVELRILRRLFTSKEAELALHLTLIPEKPQVIARRAKLAPDQTADQLEKMAKKGLIFRVAHKNRPTLYMSAQYVIGIWEYHVNDLDKDLIRDMNEYIPTLLNLDTWKKAPQLRTIPVSRSLNIDREIMTYENAEGLIRSQKKFVVAPCICRREAAISGEACDKPVETCLVFGLAADYYHKNGIGREIDQQEALDIIRKADEAGLVLQPSNAKKIVNICCCCGCCCQILKNIKRHPKPASVVSSAFIVSADPETCKGCGICVDRCQMDALRVEDKKVIYDANRCIGCGLCVSTCPTQSLVLVRKPEPDQPVVPKNVFENYLRLGRARGKLGPLDLAKMKVKSEIDRRLAKK
jgi:Na+-translocating ferredoxin:NAD+ oxidoreductase subunit B